MVLFETEIQRYVRWVRALERISHERPGGLSRWYQGPVFSVYTRAGTPGSRLRGRNSLCFGDIAVREEYQGKGFFGMLVAALASEEDFPFDRLEIESLLNVRFGQWLDRNGFVRFSTVEGWGDMGACFYRLLPAGKKRVDGKSLGSSMGPVKS
jgi:GNAT superfamily N-acetyltransferase